MIWWCYECESLAKVTRKYFTSKKDLCMSSVLTFSSPKPTDLASKLEWAGEKELARGHRTNKTKPHKRTRGRKWDRNEKEHDDDAVKCENFEHVNGSCWRWWKWRGYDDDNDYIPIIICILYKLCTSHKSLNEAKWSFRVNVFYFFMFSALFLCCSGKKSRWVSRGFLRRSRWIVWGGDEKMMKKLVELNVG